jgi:hypothetical protein
VTDLAEFVQLQYRVAAFLAGQNAGQLRALIEGRLSLTLVQAAETLVQAGEPAFVSAAGSEAAPTQKQSRPAPPPVVAPRSAAPPDPVPRKVPSRRGRVPVVDADVIAARLRSCESMDEAAELLHSLNLSAEGQKDVVRALGLTPKGRKAEVATQILKQAVGARAKFAALRQG